MEMCDSLMNQLLPHGCSKIVFPYSRIFCDVEKFRDDSKEILSKKGNGSYLYKRFVW